MAGLFQAKTIVPCKNDSRVWRQIKSHVVFLYYDLLLLFNPFAELSHFISHEVQLFSRQH